MCVNMKKQIILLLFIVSAAIIKAEYSKTVVINAGELINTLSLEERNSVTHLTILGEMNAVDFVTIRDRLPQLTTLDLSGVRVVEYIGNRGTIDAERTYPANRIPDYSFGQLTGITIGGPWIPEWETSGKESLESITLPSAITTIGSCAFAGCKNIKSFTIPESVQNMDSYAFYGCSSLDSISFPSSLKVIGYSAFVGCANLKYIFIPSTIESIGTDAFGRCNVPIFVDVNNKYYSSLDGVLFNKTKTKLLHHPNLKQSIYIIPSTVDTIHTLAFAGNTNLKVISIPSTLRIIGSSAFAGCTELNTIFINTSFPLNLPVSGNSDSPNTVFEGVSTSKCTVYVSKGSRERFLSDDSWSIFSTIVEGEGIAFSVSPLYINESNSSTDTLEIFSNTCWSATSNMDWLRVNPESSVGGLTKMCLTVSNNSDYEPRTATITFIGEGISTQNVTITQAPKEPIFNLHISPGKLNNSLNFIEKRNATSLTITGAIDARDFKIIRDSMPQLVTLDISNVDIAEYSGNAGTTSSLFTIYSANALPDYSFFNSVTNEGKSKLTSIRLPQSINSIGSFSFRECIGLKKIELPSKVKTIGQYSFYGCTLLDSMIIPSSVSYIGSSAFKNCKKITSISIPDSVYAIADNTFMECEKLKSVELPSSINFLGDYAFSKCSSLDTITIPSTVTIIGDYAFASCSNLKSVIIPQTEDTASVSIRQNAFCNCVNLASITLPSNLVIIGNNAFQNCKKLDSIIIPKSVVSIENYAFHSCNALRKLTFNSGSVLKNIGINAFQNCKLLESVILTSNIARIGAYAFDGCESIKYVDLSLAQSLATIDNSTFRNCSTLVSISIGPNVKTLGSNAFLNCVDLKSISVPSNLTRIGAFAFGNCISLNHVLIPETVILIEDNVFNGCTGLVSVELSSKITTIGEQLFRNCSSLDSIFIPSSVRSIGNLAFYGCVKLSKATIPGSVTFIGERAFYGCSGLKEVYVYNPQPVYLSSPAIFEDVDKYNCSLFVPIGSKVSYQSANVWSDFLNISEVQIPTSINSHVNGNIQFVYNTENDILYFFNLIGMGEVSIYNVSGVELLRKSVSDNYRLAINEFPKGVYLIKIKALNEECSWKVVKR